MPVLSHEFKGRKSVEKHKLDDDDDYEEEISQRTRQRMNSRASSRVLIRSRSQSVQERVKRVVRHARSSSPPKAKMSKNWTPWGEVKIIEVVIPDKNSKKKTAPPTVDHKATALDATSTAILLKDVQDERESLSSTMKSRPSSSQISSSSDSSSDYDGYFSFEANSSVLDFSLDLSVASSESSIEVETLASFKDKSSEKIFQCGLVSFTGFNGCHRRRRHVEINQVLVTLWTTGCPTPVSIHRATAGGNIYIAEFDRKEWNKMENPDIDIIERPKLVNFDRYPLPFEPLKVIRNCAELVALKPIEEWRDEGMKKPSTQAGRLSQGNC